MMGRSKGVSAVHVVVAIAVVTVGILAIVGYDTAQAVKVNRKCKPDEQPGTVVDRDWQASRCGPRR